jgi:hypothetical protein
MVTRRRLTRKPGHTVKIWTAEEPGENCFTSLLMGSQTLYFIPGVKWPGPEGGSCPLSSAEGEDSWRHTFTSHIPLQSGA